MTKQKRRLVAPKPIRLVYAPTPGGGFVLTEHTSNFQFTDQAKVAIRKIAATDLREALGNVVEGERPPWYVANNANVLPGPVPPLVAIEEDKIYCSPVYTPASNGQVLAYAYVQVVLRVDASRIPPEHCVSKHMIPGTKEYEDANDAATLLSNVEPKGKRRRVVTKQRKGKVTIRTTTKPKRRSNVPVTETTVAAQERKLLAQIAALTKGK